MNSSRFTISSILLALAAFSAAPTWAADGAGLYAEHCASCHGESGDADTALGRAMKVPALDGKSWTTPEVRDALRGNEKHKTVSGKVTDEDLEALRVHLDTLSKADS